MPYQGLADGLYLAKRPALTTKIVDHFGVIDIGNRLGYPLPPMAEPTPVVIHQTAEGLKAEVLSGQWNIEARIDDESGAKARIQTAMATPDYDLFGNNCEHFARFIASGVKESKQLQVAAFVGIAGLAIWGLSNLESGAKTSG
jgi:hypothetical protein